jgi:Rod binding domain-containing protein
MDALSTQTTQISNILAQRGSGQIEAAKSNLSNMTPEKMEELDNTAKEFEAVFLSQMFAQMFNGLEVDPVFGGGKGEEVFRSMMVEEYGKRIADQGGIGIAEHVKAKLIDIQAQQTAHDLNANTQTRPK